MKKGSRPIYQKKNSIVENRRADENTLSDAIARIIIVRKDVDYKSTLSQGSIKEFDLSKLWQSSGYIDLRPDHTNNKRESIKP